jgi:hypothetical protein
MKRIILLLAMVALSGCATIFTDSSDRIEFKSKPEGARVEINGVSVGRTPITATIKRNMTVPTVQLKLDGYETQQILMQNSFNAVSLLNVFFWPGFIVDAATGTIMKHEVLCYEVELEAKKKM